VGKMAFWSTKAALSLKRVKIEKKLLWGAYRKSPSLFRTVPFRTPYGLPFPKIGGSHPTQNFNHYYLRNGKSYGFQAWPVHPEGPSEQKPIKIFGEKGAWAYPGTAQFFRVPLLSHEREKLRISNFACTFIGSIGIKAH